jgi:hypothetical protein
MKNLNFSKRHFLIALFSGLLAVTLLITPAMSEMTPEQKFSKAKELAAEASALAAQAKETGDIALAQQAKDKANEAAQLISEVTVTAQETGNTELAQAAYNASMELSTSIAEIIGAAAYIAQTSTDSGTVDAANTLLVDIGDIQDLNSTNIELGPLTLAPSLVRQQKHMKLLKKVVSLWSGMIRLLMTQTSAAQYNCPSLIKLLPKVILLSKAA